MTRTEYAQALGISRARLYQLLAAERRREAEWLPPPADLPHVPLSWGPTRGLHYNLEDDHASRLPDCPFRIARGTGRGLRVEHRDSRRGEKPAEATRSAARFKPRDRRKRKDRAPCP
jgi:hypothetical protein